MVSTCTVRRSCNCRTWVSPGQGPWPGACRPNRRHDERSHPRRPQAADLLAGQDIGGQARVGSGRNTYLSRERTTSAEAVHGSPADTTPAVISVTRFGPFRDPFREFRSALVHAASGTRAPLGIPMDVYRGEDGSYHVEADLPGAGLDRVEVTVEHVVLTIQAERTSHYGDSVQVIVAERPRGGVRAAALAPLGGGVDSENLTAGYADGVRHVTIPASPKAHGPPG